MIVFTFYFPNYSFEVALPPKDSNYDKRHRAVTPNPTPTIILCLTFFWFVQGLESGKENKKS